MACLATAILLFQALFHGHLSGIDEYDDGVYFGGAINLVHGVLPYRDFAFIQPPGIVVLLSPVAALSALIGTAHAFELARLLVVVVSIANVVLVGLLVRHRPPSEVAVATATMAIFPGMVGSSQTVLIEPFLVALCLGAFLLVFRRGRVTLSHRMLLGAGFLLGAAIATKLWAIAPLLVLLAVVHFGASKDASNRGARYLIGGAMGGFCVLALPFIAAAPHNFFSQVFVVQAIRAPGGYGAPERAIDLVGLSGLLHWLTPDGLVRSLSAVLLAAVMVATVTHTFVRKSPSFDALERSAILSAAFVAGSLMLAPTYYYHYSGFMAPFAALSAAAVYRCLRSSRRSRRSVMCWFTMAGVLFGATTAVDVAQIATAHRTLQIQDAMSDAIPAGGCIFAVNPSVPILDNRYTSDVAGCPSVVDFLGQQRALDSGSAQSNSDRHDRKVQATILHWLQSSDVIVIDRSTLPVDSSVARYVNREFAVDRSRPEGMTVLVRRRNDQKET
jgi:alpha-1,2-mannosyltransferase